MEYKPTPVDGGAITTADELACAAFANSRIQAERYCEVLDENGIDVTLGEEFRVVRDGSVAGTTIPVLVLSSCQELATELIAFYEATTPARNDDHDDFIDDDNDDDLDDDDEEEDDADFCEDDDFDDDDDDDKD